MMKLTPEDAIWAADQFIAYFQDIDQIENYFRSVKMDRVANITPTLFDEQLEDAFFDDFTMSPEDMDFNIVPVGSGGLDNDYFSELLGVVASHVIEDSIPGRELKWLVTEKNTGKVVGFIRFGSPTINSKPRNDYLGAAPDLGLFNRHACMGFIIVPTQPFGFNYLGGKLLALMCASHFAREEELMADFETDMEQAHREMHEEQHGTVLYILGIIINRLEGRTTQNINLSYALSQLVEQLLMDMTWFDFEMQQNLTLEEHL